MKELPALSGTVIVKGSVGYVSQEAWVFSATLRDNILFGLPYESDRYETVLEACALNKVLNEDMLKAVHCPNNNDTFTFLTFLV